MPVLAALPRQIFKPLLLGFFVILAGVGLADNPNSTQTVFFELTATLLALTFSVYLMVRNLPSEISWVTKSHSTEWLPTIIPLFLLAVAQVLVRSIDILFVGHFLETTAIGIYSAASRTAQLAAFGLMAVNGVLPALVSRYYALGQMQDVQKLVSVATWVCFLFSAVATGFIWGFGMQALGLFGPEFTEGYTALCILAAGQLVNALSGSVSFVLAMTGRTMLILYTYLIATLASVLLSIVIIPRFGIEGAALVTASITGAANLALAYICIRKVQVNPTIFAFKTRPVTK
jgi:O-antigen/teichoic acid export membrane protein